MVPVVEVQSGPVTLYSRLANGRSAGKLSQLSPFAVFSTSKEGAHRRALFVGRMPKAQESSQNPGNLRPDHQEIPLHTIQNPVSTRR